MSDGRAELEVVGDGEEEVDADGEEEDGEVGAAELAEGVELEVVGTQGEEETDALDGVAGDSRDFEEGGKGGLGHPRSEVHLGVLADVDEAVDGVDGGW